MVKREYVVYYPKGESPMLYLVTSTGEGFGIDNQRWKIEIASATRGRPVDPIRLEMTCKLKAINDFVEERLNARHPGANREWRQYMCRIGLDGKYEAGPGSFMIAMRGLIDEFGPELARERIQAGDEPEVVNLCGGLNEALAVLDAYPSD